MLREIHKTRQIVGEHARRWWSDEELDLIVWYTKGGHKYGFQLVYDKQKQQRALTYKPRKGWNHAIIDDGEMRRLRYKATPVLLNNGQPNWRYLKKKFKQSAVQVDKSVSDYVLSRLKSTR